MSQWSSSDSGILRKNKAGENLEELLVFGYSCKIFKDDEKALYIDQGKHLIPWMGDETLKIDRYDCRGALYDIKQYEASKEGYDAMRWLGLSESERKLEELCDNERYYSLEINEEEEEMYKEEAAKREKTNAISFNYDHPKSTVEEQTEGIPTVPEKEEEDQPYVPSPILDVPVDISIPKTVKEYARIEKTALFVTRQGQQMEILIKTKQADNPQFKFLIVGDPLYKFYRHLLTALKNGRYQPQCEKKQEQAPSHSNDDQDSHYLHPSLSSSSKPDTTQVSNPPIPTVPYRPSADCAYSQLVNRIQGTGFVNNTAQVEQAGVAMGGIVQVGAAANKMGVPLSLEQQYHQYYYVQQYYDYWRHAILNSEQGALYANLPAEFSQLDTNMQTYIHQVAWAHYVQQHKLQEEQAKANNNSYAQIVSNLNKDGANPYTVNMPQLPPPEPTKVQTEPVKTQATKESNVTVVKTEPEKVVVKQPLLSLAAAYGSGSESSDSESSDSEESNSENRRNSDGNREVYRIPSGETQVVIDKMADYVSKNGEQFEEIIKEKGDPRFQFLNEDHEFNKYYRAKLKELKGEKVKDKVEEKKPSKPKKLIAPVSFSIKKAKDEAPREIKSALPMEDSEEEESYLDYLPKSPQNASASKDVINNGTNASQKLPISSKMVYKIGQPMVTVVQQPKQGLLTSQNEDRSKNLVDKDLADQDVSSEKRTISPVTKQISPRNSPRSPHRSPIRQGSRSPRKRSASPIKSPVESKRAKSRSETPKRRSPIRRKKSPIFDIFDVGDVDEKTKKKTGDTKDVNGTSLVEDDPILEMMRLEEKEKTGEEKSSEAQDKALQLERKRKAAMFLKLKLVDSGSKKPLPLDKNSDKTLEKAKPPNVNSEDSQEKLITSTITILSSPEISKRTSEDSVKTDRSLSKIKDKNVPRDSSRSRSNSSRRSKSREKRKKSKKHKKDGKRDRSESPKSRDDDRRKKKDKKKKEHKRKHSKSKKKSRKHHKKSKSRSRSKSSHSRSRSRSISSHISIDDSS